MTGRLGSDVAPATAGRAAGIVADGVFKVLLGAGYVAGHGWLGERLGVAGWLPVLAGVALLAGGAVELALVRRRAEGAYIRLMAGYDAGWLLATLAGLLVAWMGGSAGGEVWVGYQTAAAPVLGALLAGARSVRPAAPVRTAGSAA
ncbi:hypothetical protein GCM10010400_65750 [Streptomyces aculeolatus]|uniref:hypothetical protein n=1 Tax=Streptomyces aculeolatus TaxID=270689 RepID=UPI001CED2A33|nr:hypothetical protein [Streptomyces aculeolatus]